MKEVKLKEIFVGKLKHGADLLEELTDICKEKNIQLGRVEAIGAVQKAVIGYYHQDKREYEYLNLDKHLEILNLTGNISIKDGNPMVHAHVTLADAEGKAFGGHLAPGTIIFACECVIEAFDGVILKREFDEETGLPLWNIEK
ncbi:MAG: DNA-binding protein [Deltaproteobacteria bacterium]|nr:DNA-binding protein [Deltaproteobacteria bacterium]